ncbi:hypothetical protein SKAU_G00216860 [Synaphobranchus kaupii]|uniref:Uncharacterized protein n=1 Tax=Synaphobranchus kaupii TaxID=118154 RepID=A0A9Q1F9Z5_SYNKA|nr:hypothetical protein SKAU_G00216860 [Synaphobranchus kaupii]
MTRFCSADYLSCNDLKCHLRLFSFSGTPAVPRLPRRPSADGIWHAAAVSMASRQGQTQARLCKRIPDGVLLRAGANPGSLFIPPPLKPDRGGLTFDPASPRGRVEKTTLPPGGQDVSWKPHHRPLTPDTVQTWRLCPCLAERAGTGGWDWPF